MEGVQVPSAFYFPEVKKNLSAHLKTHLNLLLIGRITQKGGLEKIMTMKAHSFRGQFYP